LDRKIRVGAVSYLNTKPLLYGIRRSAVMEDVELKIDYPSKIASMLLNDEIDLGLVPVAIVPQMKKHYFNGDYCIGSDGPVASVCLFSEVPIEKVKTILLDYQSRSSVQLVRILAKKYWNIDPEFVDGGEEFRKQIIGSVAAVVVGDRALEQLTSTIWAKHGRVLQIFPSCTRPGSAISNSMVNSSGYSTKRMPLGCSISKN